MAKIKICGITDRQAMDAAVAASAEMVGLVFFENSPRHLDYEAAAGLASVVRAKADIVALTVDPDDSRLDAIAEHIAPDYIQLHGRESAARVRAIRERYGTKVIKAVGVSSASDLATLVQFEGTADLVLLDARPPRGSGRPGGHGMPFDWAVLDELDPALGYMLSGGLDPDNVASAVRRTRPYAVDVSSGVEHSPGKKDPAMIARFVAAVRSANREIVGT